MFLAIDPASGPDRCVLSDGRGNVMDAPRRGKKIVQVHDYASREIAAVGPFDGLRVVNWRRAKRMVRRGEAMCVRLSTEFI